MLWLHLGMPKTGTTALQGFLRDNSSALADAGLHYMEAGRRRLEGKTRLVMSHNIIAFHINQTNEPMDPFRAAMTSEFDDHADRTCLVSSEMFYSVDLARLAQVFAEIPARQLRITFYCRRYSDFFEADYKQRAKNGRLVNAGSGYIKAQLAQIEANPAQYSFAAKVADIRTAFPGVTVVPMLYDRAEMANGHVVADFLTRVGTPVADDLMGQQPANPSQSRAASEAFGIVTRAMGRRKSRQLRRTTLDYPVMVRRNDVLEPDERAWLDDYMAGQDLSFQREFFPDRHSLFSQVELSAQEQAFRRDTPQEYEALRKASEIVFRLALEAQP